MTTRRVVLPLAGVAAAAVGLLLGSGDLFAGQGSSVGAASVDFAVKRDSDAAEEAAGKEVDLDSSDLELVFDDGNQTVGVRFDEVSIEPGSTITNAYIQFTCDDSDDTKSIHLTVRGEAADNPGTFAEKDGDISSRATTKAQVKWSPEVWTAEGEAGPKQRTPDLSAIVQEIISRPGWAKGNAMVFTIIGTGSGVRVAASFEDAPPVLHVESATNAHIVQFAEGAADGPEDGNRTNLVVTLTPAVPNAAISVDYKFADITTDSKDYSPHAAGGTLTFAPGVTTQKVNVTIGKDATAEGPEQFKVALSNPKAGGVDVGLGGNAEMIYTINDRSPEVAFAETAARGDESTPSASAAVKLTKSWDAPVTVSYALQADGSTAGSPADFKVLGTGSVTFRPGETTKNIELAIVDDDVEEQKEHLVLALLDPVNATLGATLTFKYSINANDLTSSWPMWRYGAGHTAATEVGLPSNLHLQWVLELPQLEPAWPRGDGAVTGAEDLDVEDGYGRRMTFDLCYAPIVVGKMMYVGSSADDSIRAYDTETGKEKWCFYTNAPVRFAPAAWDGKLYCVSDDGHLYCLDARNGSLKWKFQGGPSDRMVVGNKRLGSSWPARGAAVVADGKVYFAAGIWPFMGVFIHALDAQSGEVEWINDGSGSLWMQSPHSGAFSFNALAPQGYITVAGETLIVPNGRAVAAGLSRGTGELLYYHFATNKRNGTAFAAAIEPYFNNSGRLFNVSDGEPVGDPLTDGTILTESTFYASTPKGGRIDAIDTSDFSTRWSYTAADIQEFCKAGNTIYTGSPGKVIALVDAGSSARVQWEKSIVGTPGEMAVGDDKLFVVTEEGYIYCFGDRDTGATLPAGSSPKPIEWPQADQWTAKAKDILTQTGEDRGFCLVLGIGSGRLMEELARQSELNVVGIDPSARKIEKLRTHWDKMGIAHDRLSALPGEIASMQLPPYLANLIVSEDLRAAGKGNAFVEKTFLSLRPYGGKVCFDGDFQKLFKDGIEAAKLAKAEVTQAGGYTLLERVGALPGAADWSHQYADAANTVVSKDKLVKAPLGLLWYGGSSNKQILPRHRHGPSEHVVGGRLFIQGPDIIRAVDVYTGRVIWEADLPKVGDSFVKRPIFRENESHEPGANHMGSNYATAPDGLYVGYGTNILRLDPATGRISATFTTPNKGYNVQVKLWEDLLIVGSSPMMYDDSSPGEDNWNAAGSKELVVMDRYSGKTLWQRDAQNAFHHNSIIAAEGMVFCIDRLAPGQEAHLRRRGMTPSDVGAKYTVLALNIRTGDEIWTTNENVFGTWLAYSEERDILMQSGRKSPDMVSDEVTGRIITYNGKNGEVMWDRSEGIDDGPYLLHGDVIYMQNSQYNFSTALKLLTGKVHTRTDPLTGEQVPWRFMRNKGCNSIVACENLLTFRSGAPAYYDLSNYGGIGHFGGFKSGCSTNLIPANGVLNAPDYTRSCNCSYQNQTSLAMVYMPEVEVWTHGAVETPTGEVRQAGINFGAPGDRLAENGTLWMEYPVPEFGEDPKNGFTFPNLGIQTTPEEPEVFAHHSTRFGAGEISWVTASGAVGLTSVTVPLGNTQERAYRVRLYFSEPEGAKPGQRKFDVAVQGRRVLDGFDVAKAAGSEGNGIVKEFTGVVAQDALSVTLTPSARSPIQQPVISGIEILPAR